VDEARLFGGVVNECARQAVDVARCAGAALRGKAGGFVERDDAIVLEDHQRAHHVGVGRLHGHAGLVVLRSPWAILGCGHRWDANRLAGLHAGVGLGAGAAIDADLSGCGRPSPIWPCDQAMEFALQPAIEARIVLVPASTLRLTT